MSHPLSRRLLAAIATLVASLALAVMSALPAAAKTPGKTYCFLGVCHRVQTLAETERQVGKTVVKHTSHYDDCAKDRFNPCGLTSSGEVFNPNRPDNAASPIYPNGTKLLVHNPTTKLSAVIRVNNAGPYWGSRTLDVSRAAAERLGFAKQGVARLEIKVIRAPTRAEATYSRNRVYTPVPGPIGAFGSIDQAFAGVASAFKWFFTSPVHAAAGRPTRPETAAHAVSARISPAVLKAEAARRAAAVAAEAKAERVRRTRHAAALAWSPKPSNPEMASIAAATAADEEVAAATVMAMLMAPPGTTEAERTLTRLVYAKAIPDLLEPAEIASMEDAAPLPTAPADVVRAMSRLVHPEDALELPDEPLLVSQDSPQSASPVEAARAGASADDGAEVAALQAPPLVRTAETALARIVHRAPRIVKASLAHDATGRYLKLSLPAIE